MPRPTRRLFFFEPSAGLIVFNRIKNPASVLRRSVGLGHLHEVADPVDHPARCRRVLDLDRVVRPLEAEPARGRAMALPAAGSALRERDPQHLLLGHRHASISCSTVMPRLAAMSAGAFEFSSALIVARTR